MKYLTLILVLFAGSLAAQTQIRFVNDHPHFRSINALRVDGVVLTTDIHYSTVYYLPNTTPDGTYLFDVLDQDGYAYSGYIVVQCVSPTCQQIVSFKDLLYVLAPPPIQPPEKKQHKHDENCSTEEGKGSKAFLIVVLLLSGYVMFKVVKQR